MAEKRVLLTEDRDFGELVFRGQKSAYCVVLVRIPAEARQKKADRITTLVQQYEADLVGAVVIMTLNTIRIRSLPAPDTNGES